MKTTRKERYFPLCSSPDPHAQRAARNVPKKKKPSLKHLDQPGFDTVIYEREALAPLQRNLSALFPNVISQGEPK